MRLSCGARGGARRRKSWRTAGSANLGITAVWGLHGVEYGGPLKARPIDFQCILKQFRPKDKNNGEGCLLKEANVVEIIRVKVVSFRTGAHQF